MPKRMIDDSLLDSRSLEVLSPGAQDAFPRFILIADDFGCFEINPVKLRALGWSRRPDVTEAMVEGWITEYAERQATDPGTGQRLAPMAMIWTHVGRRYAFLTGWFGPHGQKRRAEYDASAPAGTPGRHGSKRRTPAPPADLLAEVMAGNVRAVDGKPPGTDREPAGSPETEIHSLFVPAREMTGNEPGNGRDGAGKCHVPAPAVPVPVPVPDAGADGNGAPALNREQVERETARRLGAEARGGLPTDEERWAEQYPRLGAVVAAVRAAGCPADWPKAATQRHAADLAVGTQAPGDVAARVAVAIAETGKPWLGWHVDVIRGASPPAGRRNRGMAIPDTDWTSEAATKL